MNEQECGRLNNGSCPPECTKVKRHNRMFQWLCLCAVALLCHVCTAEERCGAEVKLLLSATDIPTTIAALKAQKGSSGDIYFFDTDSRELLSQGVIVRLRRGVAYDLTVKLRPPRDRKLTDPTGGTEDFKCEMDLSGNEENTSYSVRKNYSEAHIPETGNEIYQALSTGQKELLVAAQVKVDWNQVKRVVDIKATDWKIKGDSRFKKVALELWEWPEGRILELSTKTKSEEVEAAFEQLRELAIGKGLKLSSDQRSKTRMMLE
jgi:hypothetical protein